MPVGGEKTDFNTTISFILSNVQPADTGDYTLVVKNAYGAVASAVMQITVAAAEGLPVITAQPQGVAVASGGTATLSVTATSATPLTYLWTRDGNFLAGTTGPTLTISNVQPANLGVYRVRVTNPVGTLAAGSADAALSRFITGARTVDVNGRGAGVVLVEVYDAGDAGANAHPANVSARNQVGAGVDVLVSGFVIDRGAKTVLIRGIGPALNDVFGVTGVLADPKLEIHQTVNGQDTIIATNDN